MKGSKKARRFVKSFIWFFPHSLKWLAFVHDLYDRHTGDIPPLEMVRSKFTGNYYSRRQPTVERLRLLISHYTLLERWFDANAMASLLDGHTFRLCTLSGKAGETYTVSLGRHDRFRFEGELTLFLHYSGNTEFLAALTFTFEETTEDKIRVRIGGLQGPAGPNAKDEVVQATKNLNGYRPKSVVLDALYAIAEATGCSSIEAVDAANHPLNSRNHHMVAANDAFWGEISDEHTATGAFRLPIIQPSRALEDVPAKRRKDWLARQSLKAQMRFAVQMAWNALQRPDPLTASEALLAAE